jgi:hypothetical protein
MHRVFHWLSFSVIAIGSAVLVLGALLFRAAHVTNAASDYTIPVSWSSALTSVLWPPSRLPVLLLLAVIATVGITSLIFFLTPRWIGVPLLLIEAGLFYYFGGWLGWHFLPREFIYWRFSMDGEKLGEYWFSLESLAVWSAAVAVLAFLRLVPRKHIPNDTEA